MVLEISPFEIKTFNIENGKTEKSKPHRNGEA